MKIRLLVPLVLFAVIVSILWRGLQLHPERIPSPLINKPAPHFDLPDLLSSGRVTTDVFHGQVILLNVWATWCQACAAEHEYLVDLAKNARVVFYGLNYKDDPTAALHWLHEYGNPYQQVAVDSNGDAAINWGVYGAPETFIIDKHGVVRYKQIGPITPQVWVTTLKPLIDKLQEAA